MVAHNVCRVEAYFGPQGDRLSNKFAIAKTAVTLHGRQSIGGEGNALTFNAFANTALRSDRQMALDTRESKRSMKTRLFLLGFAGVAFAISAPACSLQLQPKAISRK